MHGLNEGHIAPYTDIEFQLTKYQTYNYDQDYVLYVYQTWKIATFSMPQSQMSLSALKYEISKNEKMNVCNCNKHEIAPTF